MDPQNLLYKDADIMTPTKTKKIRLAHVDLLESLAIFFVMVYHGTLYSSDF